VYKVSSFRLRHSRVIRALSWVLAVLLLIPLSFPFVPAHADVVPISTIALAIALHRAEPKTPTTPVVVPSAASRLADIPYNTSRGPVSVAATQSALLPKPIATSHQLTEQGTSLTLLDEVGHLVRPITMAQVLTWKRELTNGQLPTERRALLHLWLGEWQLSYNAQPRTSAEHFRTTQHLTAKTDRLHGLAAYDTCLTFFYQGAYSQATDAFQALLRPKTIYPGYDLRKCALWLRHASACAGYHDQRAKQGIPEPPRLDPECGIAALAAGLRSLKLPYDRNLLLKSCRVTGQGSSLADIQEAGIKMGVTVHILGADDQGLMALPKPLIAHVEHDHFVALVRADKAGVSYLCSDCGAWPGGRVNLTWKQWHLLEADTYGAICLKGSAWDKILAAALAASRGTLKNAQLPVEIASAGQLTGLGAARISMVLPAAVVALRRHIVRVLTGGRYSSCDRTYGSLHCIDNMTCCWIDTSGPEASKSQMGSSAGAPVNLATGEEEYASPSDLTVYNPNGPSITWRRFYHDLGGLRQETPSGGFGYGWSTPYDYSIAVGYSNNSYTIYVVTPSGGYFSGSANTSSAPTAANPRIPVVLPPGTPMSLEWDYNPSLGRDDFVLTFPDRSQWQIAQQTGRFSSYPFGNYATFYTVSRITDRNGNYIIFNNFGNTGPSTITDSNGKVLLSINVDPNSHYMTSVSDTYGRSIYYHVGLYGLVQGTNQPHFPNVDQVSQIVPSTVTSTTALSQYRRFTYGYTTSYGSHTVGDGAAFLHTITVPSPMGSGTSTSTINYNDSVLVSSIVDANRNTRTYNYSSADGNHTSVTVTDPNNVSIYSYTVGYNGDMSGTSKTDGSGNSIVQKMFQDPNNPLRPSSVTDGNNKVTQCIWDSFGNLHQKTSPRGTVTNYTYAFPTGNVPSIVNSVVKPNAFALGELISTTEGTKTATSYTYYEPSGLINTITKPVPGTINGPNTVSYSFTYDSLGDCLTMRTPGNNSTVIGNADQGIVTTFNYGSSPAIGQPLTETDNVGQTIRFGYDRQGNRTSMSDALGNETDISYNLANQPLTTTAPATGQTGNGRATQTNNYLYVGGPLANSTNSSFASVTSYDESGQAVRAINDSYGPEGEPLSVTGSTEPVSYGYDALYRQSSLTDGSGNTTHYYYTAQGYLGGVTYPGYSGSAWPNLSGKDSLRFTNYDPNGNALQRVDGNGVATNYTYNADPESLLTQISYVYPAGYTGGMTGTVSFAYDSYGRRGSMNDGTGSVTYTYDDADNPLSVTTTYTNLPAQGITYSYYSDNSRESMGTPAGTFSYQYDSDGRLSQLTNPYGEISNWQYLNNSWLQKQILANSSGSTVAATTYTYNPRGQMTDLQTRNGAGTLLSDFTTPRVGGYDGVGNRTQVTASIPSAPARYSGTTTYAYDYGQKANPALNRSQLTQEASTRLRGSYPDDVYSYTDTFSYDGGTSTGPGNPTSFQGPIHTFNVDNQDTSNTYDGNGNPTTYNSSGLLFTFDPENRPTVFSSLGSTGTYTAAYTGDGLRALKLYTDSSTNSSRSIYYLYDGDKPVCELDSTATVKMLNTFGSNGLVSRRGRVSGLFYTFDMSGNVAQRLDSTGNINSTDLCSGFGQRQTNIYDRSGQQRTTSAYDVFGFSGQWGAYTEETSLVLMTHRYYDPQSGRFLTRDPISYKGGINLYGYCQNDPSNQNDPLGLSCLDVLQDCVEQAISASVKVFLELFGSCFALVYLAARVSCAESFLLGPEAFAACMAAACAAGAAVCGVAAVAAAVIELAYNLASCYWDYWHCPGGTMLICLPHSDSGPPHRGLLKTS